MMAADYRHIGGVENRLGRHYSRFSPFWPAASFADQSLALRKSWNAGSNRRSQASDTIGTRDVIVILPLIVSRSSFALLRAASVGAVVLRKYGPFRPSIRGHLVAAAADAAYLGEPEAALDHDTFRYDGWPISGGAD